MTSSSHTTASKRPTTTGGPVLSPHLQIWRFTVTMAASITHRACGVALYTGSVVLALWLYATASNAALYGLMASILSSPLGVVILFGYCWALFFHMANGIRHLFWDVGRGFEMSTAKQTAWAAYIGATVLALIVVAIGVSSAGGV